MHTHIYAISGHKTRSGYPCLYSSPPSKIAWIYLVLFVRIGAFQWVTPNPNKKICPPATLCLKSHNPTLSCLLAAGKPCAARGFDPANEKIYSIDSDSRKDISQLSAMPPRRTARLQPVRHVIVMRSRICYRIAPLILHRSNLRTPASRRGSAARLVEAEIGGRFTKRDC
jgi:hypothetical protein